MAILVWTGATSTDSTVLTNWVIEGTSTNPTTIATTDTFKFNSSGAQACSISQATVGCVVIEETMAHQVTFTPTTFNTDAMVFGNNVQIHMGAVNDVVFSGNHSSQVGMPYQDHNVVFDGEVVWGSSRQNTVFQLDPGGSTTYISNGQFPRVKMINSGSFSLNPATSVTGTYKSAEMITLEITANITFTNTYLTLGTAKKVIEITSTNYTAGKQFLCAATTLDMKNAVLHLYADNNQFVPTSHDTTNFGGATFTCELGDVILDAVSQEKIYLANGKTLVCDSLEIKKNCVLLGGEHPNEASIIKVASRPKLRGTWNFKGLSEGIYQSVGVEPQLGGGGGGAVSSVFGRTGAVVATEGDYDLDELGDVDVTSAVETQILRHDGTSFVNDYNDVFFLRVKAREAINKGEAVYIFDAHNSNVVGVKKARADSASTMPCIGIAYETLALGDEGLIVAFGKANGIAANFTEGETMYVSPTTAGALTNTKPTGNTQLIQNVGILMQAHASNAVVKVTGVGRTNDVPNQFSVGGSITAGSFVKSGGTSSEFLKADGSVDTNTYITTAYTDADAIAAVEGEATLALSGDVTIASGKDLTVDTNTLHVDATNNRVGVGTASPSTNLHVESSGTTIGLVKSSGGHANIRIDRASNSYDAALLFYTGGTLGWRIQESGTGNDLYIIDQDGSPDTARMRFHDAGTVEVSQAFQQGTVTSAVLVADSNGVLTAASALQDLSYLQPNQAETDRFTTTVSGPAWASPPATIQEAIERMALYVTQEISALGGAPTIP